MWKKSGSWDIDQTALGQLDCSIFKPNISLEQNNEIPWFLAWWYEFMKIKCWLKNIDVGVATVVLQLLNRLYLKNELKVH